MLVFYRNPASFSTRRTFRVRLRLISLSCDKSLCPSAAGIDWIAINIDRLEVWRRQTYDLYEGIWLSDFLQNQLGTTQSEQAKPNCTLNGQNGNFLHLLEIAAQTLRENNLPEQAEEMTNRVMQSAEIYDYALAIIAEYVHIIAPKQEMGLKNF